MRIHCIQSVFKLYLDEFALSSQTAIYRRLLVFLMRQSTPCLLKRQSTEGPLSSLGCVNYNSGGSALGWVNYNSGGSALGWVNSNSGGSAQGWVNYNSGGSALLAAAPL